MNYYNDVDPRSCAWLRELIAENLIPEGKVDDRSIRDVQPEDLEGFTQCHFFAGIGGWPLALRLAGWPEDREVWTGSCPCQPFSVAGNKRGSSDERHLWPHFFRLIKARRPQTVFGEQVASSEVVGTQLEAAFVVAVQAGDFARANKAAHQLARSKTLHYDLRWLDGISADMEAANYTIWPEVLGAHSAGADHIRQRLYWMANAKHGGYRSQSHGASGCGEPECDIDIGRLGSPNLPRCCEQGSTEPARTEQPAAECSGVACEVDNTTGPRHQPKGQRSEVETRDQARLCGPECRCESSRMVQSDCDGCSPRDIATTPDGHGDSSHTASFWSDAVWHQCRDGNARRISPEPSLFPLAHGLPGRVGLLRGSGNAIVPEVAEVFIRAAMEILK